MSLSSLIKSNSTSDLNYLSVRSTVAGYCILNKSNYARYYINKYNPKIRDIDDFNPIYKIN